MTEQMDFIVYRAAAGVDPATLPPRIEGRWYMRPVRLAVPDLPADPGWAHFVAEPTGRFEIRDDGARAEVYEVRPAAPVGASA